MDFFSVTWRIENFSMCMMLRNDEELVSPSFTLPELKNTDFKIRLYPNGSSDVERKYVSCLIERKDHEDNSNVTLFRTMYSVVNTEIKSSICWYEESQKILGDGSLVGVEELITHKDLFDHEKGFLPNGVFTFQLRLCPKLEKQNEPDTCEWVLETKFLSDDDSKSNFAIGECFSTDGESTSLTHLSFLNHIPAERRVLIWSIKELDEKRKSKEKMSVILKSEYLEGVELLLVCYFESKNIDDESLMIDISRRGTHRNRIGVHCSVKIDYNSCPDDFKYKASKHVFDNNYKLWSFSLIENFGILKHNNSLQLVLDFSISHFLKKYLPRTLSGSSHQDYWMKKIPEMLKEEEMMDVSFECQSGKKFPAHKLLICARYPKFRAMFSDDTPERQTEVVRMQGTDTDTVERLRDYLYSSNLPDLNTEQVMKLYSVAHKYEIEELKHECLELLKKNVSVENVYGILNAFGAVGFELPDYIIDILIANDVNFESEEWKAFRAKYDQLAEVTMKKYKDVQYQNLLNSLRRYKRPEVYEIN